MAFDWMTEMWSWHRRRNSLKMKDANGWLNLFAHGAPIILVAIYYIMQMIKKFQLPNLNTHESAFLAFSAEILHAQVLQLFIPQVKDNEKHKIKMERHYPWVLNMIIEWFWGKEQEKQMRKNNILQIIKEERLTILFFIHLTRQLGNQPHLKRQFVSLCTFLQRLSVTSTCFSSKYPFSHFYRFNLASSLTIKGAMGKWSICKCQTNTEVDFVKAQVKLWLTSKATDYQNVIFLYFAELWTLRYSAHTVIKLIAINIHAINPCLLLQSNSHFTWQLTRKVHGFYQDFKLICK